MADIQRDARDANTSSGSSERRDGAPSGGANRVPWRVEGARGTDDGAPRPPRFGGPRFCLLLLGLLLVNWGVISALLVRPPERTEVPYTFFRAQVEAGSVTSVTAAEDAISGDFKNSVRYPPGDQGREVTRFSTPAGRRRAGPRGPALAWSRQWAWSARQ